MRFLVDENLGSPRLASRLPTPGSGARSGPGQRRRVAVGHGCESAQLRHCPSSTVLTRDSEDFEDLHDLVMAAVGHYAGILTVRFDNDPRHNLTDRGIATAISKPESSGVPIRDRIHVLNQWR
jgi:hypothetical protein